MEEDPQVPGSQGWADSLCTQAPLQDVSLDYKVPPAAPQSSFLLPTPVTQTRSCSAFFYNQVTFFFFCKPSLYREAAGLLTLHPVSPASCTLACQAGSLLTPPFCVGSFSR